MDELFTKLKHRLHERPGKVLNLPGPQLRESAVLAPLFVRGGEPWLLFTKRPTTLRRHAGQIAFPGGARDEEDRTLLHTALRETYEELGIPEAQIQVLGMLDEIPTVTSFRVIPFVGVIPEGFPYRPSPEEISELIEVPVKALLAANLPRVEHWNVSGGEREIYFYDYGTHTIWGATARILKDLLANLREILEPT